MLLRAIVLTTLALASVLGAVLGSASTEEPGKKLAAQYCATCHIQPLPEHLDKATWIAKVFPVMRRYMGMEPADKQLSSAHDLAALIPSSPMMSEDEWFAVASWYIDQAPASLPVAPQVRNHGVTAVFASRRITTRNEMPMTSVVQFDTVHQQIIVGDAQTHTVRVLDVSGNELTTIDVGGPPSCLVIKGNTWYLTNMAKLLPHDSAAGSVVEIRWNGRPGASGVTYTRSVIIDSLRRPTNLVVADLNQDGIDDFLIAEYGNMLGRFGWFERKRGSTFQYHELVSQPGAIRALINDINADKRPDIVVLMAQAREVVRAYINGGKGRFTPVDLVESPPSYGSSSITMYDVDKDGVHEILLTTGDNGDYDNPPFKPYHGVYIYKRTKQLQYQRVTFERFDGAYGVIPRDFDANGSIDYLSFSYFPRFTGAATDFVRYSSGEFNATSGVWSVPGADAGRWLVSDAADIDRDGDIDVLLGNVSIGPGAVTDAQAESWMRPGVQALYLINQTR